MTAWRSRIRLSDWIGIFRRFLFYMADDLGTKVCRYCGRVFERKFGRQLYCSERCREANENEHRRVCRKAERDAMLDAEVSEKLSLMSAGPVNKAGNAELCGTDFGKRFVSIKEAALLFGVSRPTIYKRITTGEIHPVKVASKTVRISVSELLTGSGLETRPNKGDFSVPVRLDEALKIYRVSRGKFFEEVRKAGIRPKKYKVWISFRRMTLTDCSLSCRILTGTSGIPLRNLWQRAGCAQSRFAIMRGRIISGG